MQTYRHPYGGTAWDITVKRDRFTRLFGISPYQVDNLPTNMKVADITVNMNGKTTEILGYILVGPRGGRKYLTTYVQYR